MGPGTKPAFLLLCCGALSAHVAARACPADVPGGISTAAPGDAPAEVIGENSGGAPEETRGGFPVEAALLLRRLRLSPARAALVPAVLRDVESVLQTRFTGCRAELFGSIAAGLGIEQSDIDACVMMRRDEPAANASQSHLVLAAADIMLHHPGLFRVVKTVPTAKVPIITVEHVPTGFNVDLSFGNYNGFYNSKLVHHMVGLDERARDVAQILKHWARVRGLTGHTMLPSYGIVTMAIFYLQQKQILPSVASLQKNEEKRIVDNWNMGFSKDKFEPKNNESLCTLLGGFFRYYTEFDYDKYMVSPFVGRPVEIQLFGDLDTVPGEFDTYRTNVLLNRTRALRLESPIVQDNFEHNSNLAVRIIPKSRRSLVDSSFRHATEAFQEGCLGFLEAILQVGNHTR